MPIGREEQVGGRSSAIATYPSAIRREPGAQRHRPTQMQIHAPPSPSTASESRLGMLAWS